MRKNPTSPLRHGFDYQDLWAAKICSEWLQNPDKFIWIQFETKPDVIDAYRFFIDDIVICTSTNKYHYYQLKYVQNPIENKWTLQDFIQREEGKSRKLDSLFQKWFISYAKLDSSIAESISFVTNGFPDDELKKYLNNNKLDIAKLKIDNPSVYDEILTQLGNVSQLQDFFNNFLFIFDGRTVDLLEDNIRQGFYTALSATESGITKLLYQIHKEGSKEHPVQLTVDDIKNWCEFDLPRPLNQQIKLPEDFQLFNREANQNILNNIKTTSQGIYIIHGNPGCGKSTYITSLIKHLTEADVPVLKHYFHISQEESNPQERLNLNRVIEAIKSEIIKYSNELGRLAHINSKDTPIEEYITQLARAFFEKGKSLVIVLDGLDHVIRHGVAEELTSFLAKACSPQQGLWIVLGMQTAAMVYLPQVIRDKCPTGNWIEITGLDLSHISRIINKNIIGLNLSGNKSVRAELIDAINTSTQGNPLHLRYTLQFLKNKLGNQLATIYDCRDIIPYDGEIGNYYKSLWNNINETSKILLIIINFFDYPINEAQLFEILDCMGISLDIIHSSFSKVLHLLYKKQNNLYIFHNSFEVFIVKQQEYCLQINIIRKYIKNWLEKSTYETIKWYELRKIAYQLGDPSQLLSINYEWFINAISYPRDIWAIDQQLQLASKAAFEIENYSKVLLYSTWAGYLNDSVDWYSSTYNKLWEISFSTNKQDTNFNISHLSARQIYLYTKIKYSYEGIEVINDAIEELNNRIIKMADENVSYEEKMKPIVISLIDIVTLDHQHSEKRIVKFINNFSKWYPMLLVHYIEELYASKQFSKIDRIIDDHLEKTLPSFVSNLLAKMDIMHKGQYLFRKEIKNNDPSCLYVLYLILHKIKIDNIPSLPTLDKFPYKVSEFDTDERANLIEIFVNNFILGVIYSILGKQEDIQNWISPVALRWPIQMMQQLFLLSIEIGNNVITSTTINYQSIIKHVDLVKPLKWPDNREEMEWQRALTDSIHKIFDFLCQIKSFLNQDLFIDLETQISYINSKHFGRHNYLQLLIRNKIPLLKADSYNQFISEEKELWRKQVDMFSERADHYIDLAILSNMHDDNDNTKIFMGLSARNIVAYGSHKDMFMDRILTAFEVYSEHDPDIVNQWLIRLAPIISEIKRFTDGDETRHFPLDYAKLLSSVNSSLIKNYYIYHADKESLFHAEDVFKYVLSSLSYDNPFDIALASTAIDQDTFHELPNIAKQKKGCQQAINNIYEHFGNITPIIENKSSSGYHSGLEEDKTDYSLISIDKLLQHLDSFDNKWEQEKYLISWCNYVIDSKVLTQKKLYEFLYSYINKKEFKNIDGKILDIMYPISYEFDNNYSFECLCWAQANNNGWQPYWSAPKDTVLRWEFLKKNFADRYKEFFTKSIIFTGMRYGKSDGYFMPVPKGVDFLMQFGEKNLAKNIIEASITCIELLMADIVLPVPEWIKSNQVDSLELLFSRLIWPSSLIRERAATEIGKLLRNPEINFQVSYGKIKLSHVSM